MAKLKVGDVVQHVGGVPDRLRHWAPFEGFEIHLETGVVVGLEGWPYSSTRSSRRRVGVRFFSAPQEVVAVKAGSLKLLGRNNDEPV